MSLSFLNIQVDFRINCSKEHRSFDELDLVDKNVSNHKILPFFLLSDNVINYVFLLFMFLETSESNIILKIKN